MLEDKVLNYLRTQQMWYPGEYYSELPIAVSLHVGNHLVLEALDELWQQAEVIRRDSPYGFQFRASTEDGK